jgi:L-aspartate oxidase
MQLANHLSNQSRVLVITKSTRRANNSYRAQGGIAAAIGNEDAPLFHYEDTIKAGCDFHNEKEVRELVENGPALIDQLKNDGLPFDKDKIGQLALGMEGAHSRKRIVHCGGDATGKHVMEHLIASIRPTIDMIENRFVYELIIHPESKKCIGIKAKDAEGNNEVYYSDHVILAVGGIGGLFSFTSNDSSVAGDGVALAYRAGAEIIDMEFIQFHPTLLYMNGKTAGLISEAVRGEGARLIDQSGMALMKGKHLLEDLAPRHIVAKEIFHQRAAGNDVYLDISMITKFEDKFPTITELCHTNGISMEDKRIPVAPGCHFLMGGIAVDSIGQTSIDGLYAIGETAATGVHGANRLASNSLLEGLYYGKKLAIHLNEQTAKNKTDVTSIYPMKTSASNIPSFPERKEIQEKMMAYAGIIRTRSELELFETWINEYDLPAFIDDSLDEWSIESIQKLFMLQTAKLVVNAALLREESRGAHNREDFSEENKRWGQLHIVQTKKGIEMRERQREHNEIEVYA